MLKTMDRVEIDHTRDALLTDFGRETLEDRYLLKGESYQDMFARVATAYADDGAHAQRVYDYMSKLWFMPATPVLSNGGAERGMPISCFLNSVADSLDGIVATWNENVALASKGGGIGTSWSNVRAIGSGVKGAGQTSGIIPFIRVMDSLTLAISQGSLRRGSAAVYLHISHPEIEEFLEIRKASGDFNRKSLNLHHGIVIDNKFMMAVRYGDDYPLIDPKTKEVRKQVSARILWQKILEIRLQTGEPYLLWEDNANMGMPKHQRALGLKVTQSNLCTEIMLHTGKDHLGEDRTAVCCLSSVNAEKFFEWRDHPTFIEDIMRFLDNVLQDFIDRAPAAMSKAVYSAMRERSVGLGLMGFHSFLQSQSVDFEGVMARTWNRTLHKHLRERADAASLALAKERGACPDWLDAHLKDPAKFPIEKAERFSNKLAIAPTASISIICGGTSAGIEPIPANIYVHKTLSGSFVIKNPYLDNLLRAYARSQPDEYGAGYEAWWLEQQWSTILEHEGSVQHLDFLTPEEKAVYKTAHEIDQRFVVEMSNDRAVKFLDQGQSVNIFLPGDVDKWDLHMLHWKMWEGGSKSAYYLRSKSVQRASFAGGEALAEGGLQVKEAARYDECLSCQ